MNTEPTPDELTLQVRALVGHILTHSAGREYDVLAAQIPNTRVGGGPVTMLDLVVDGSLPAADLTFCPPTTTVC